MVNNSKAFKLARIAVMFATIFVAMLLDKAISLGLPVSTAAVVLLITFSFCFLEHDWLTGILSFVFFGLASLIKEFIWTSPTFAIFPVYYWPFIALVPRLVSGVVAFGVYKLMLLITAKMSKAYQRQTLAITVATFTGLVANTVLFLTTLNICRLILGREYSAIIATLEIIWATNIIPEYLISMILAPHVVLGVRRGLKLGIEGNNWRLAREDESRAEQLFDEGTEQIEQTLTNTQQTNEDTK